MKKKNPTSKDVARLAGVSRTTVSLVLNRVEDSGISDKTKEIVWAAAKQLNYHPNAMARGMRMRRSNTIGLVAPWAGSESVFGKAVEGIQEAAFDHNYYTLLCHTKGERRREDVYVRYFMERRVDGIVVITSTGRQDYSNWEPLLDQKIPFVLVNSGVDDPRMSSVYVDNYLGAKMAVEHLYERGHRRIGITGTYKIGGKALYDRLRGYKDTIRQLGLQPMLPEESGNQSSKLRGRLQFEELLALAEPPTAIYATSDLAAFGAYEVARERKVVIPQELAIVGNDNYPSCEHVLPPLSSIAQPLYVAGQEAVKILMSAISGENTQPQKITLPPKLIVRGSS